MKRLRQRWIISPPALLRHIHTQNAQQNVNMWNIKGLASCLLVLHFAQGQLTATATATSDCQESATKPMCVRDSGMGSRIAQQRHGFHTRHGNGWVVGPSPVVTSLHTHKHILSHSHPNDPIRAKGRLPIIRVPTQTHWIESTMNACVCVYSSPF